ncbi:PD-(D/E)XK motif protein [Anaerosinus massiliensis]|uniref:PD-(D/E)XK motif protein n=1 Tax=Massilibacillus massiliensis TaxID=1806837 RepID=UPI000DA5EEB0|nr:PD-(D/E)XK motif protein [Massilibacillus massiliensis]
MSYTSEVYETLLEAAKDAGQGKSRLARRLKMSNGIVIIFAVDKSNYLLELYIQTDELPKKNTFPHWKGVEIGVARLPEYGDDVTEYVLLKQSYQSEGNIFQIISEDIRMVLEKLEDSQEVLPCFSAVLTKWRNFFLLEKDFQLSQEREQGLLGELIFLKQLLEMCGHEAITYWAGCNEETHDFYIKGNAVEVKTTAQKSPYKVNISSEYQLDTKDVLNSLYLQVFALRRSESDGFTLSDAVHDIEATLISDSQCFQQFEQKLEKYGYLKAYEELYQTGYFIRENCMYIVDSDFPKIEKSELDTGVSNVSYIVNIDMCQKFLVSDGIQVILKGENTDVV